MTEKKKQNLFWPDVSTVEEARKAANHGVGAAVIVAVITGGLATWAVLSKEAVIGFIDAWAYVDAVLFSAIAFGIHKESRAAAVAGLSLFIIEKAYQIQVTGKFDGAVLAVFLLLFFVSGVRGTFALRRLRAPASAPGPASPG